MVYGSGSGLRRRNPRELKCACQYLHWLFTRIAAEAIHASDALIPATYATHQSRARNGSSRLSRPRAKPRGLLWARGSHSTIDAGKIPGAAVTELATDKPERSKALLLTIVSGLRRSDPVYWNWKGSLPPR